MIWLFAERKIVAICKLEAVLILAQLAAASRMFMANIGGHVEPLGQRSVFTTGGGRAAVCTLSLLRTSRKLRCSPRNHQDFFKQKVCIRFY